MREISYTEGCYPNPEYKWIEIYLGDEKIGRADVVVGKGFRVRLGRKPLATVQDAAAKIIKEEYSDAKKRMELLKKELSKWERLRDEIRNEKG